MKYTFRKCKGTDLQFIYKLKEKCFKWYIEKIYGWNENTQIELTQKEMAEHLADMSIIQHEGKDIGIFTFYSDDIGDMFAILPEYQGKGIGTQICMALNSYKHIKKILQEIFIRELDLRNMMKQIHIG